MQLTAIRHLPTEWNERGILQGRCDIPIISELHEDMLMKVGRNKEVLALQAPFDLVLTSELVRTQQTARLHGFEQFTVEPLLNELDFGELEGKNKELLMERWGNEWQHHPQVLTFGESMVEFKERVETFINRYKEHQRILMFGHGAWLRVLSALHETGSIETMNQRMIGNCDLLTVDITTKVR